MKKRAIAKRQMRKSVERWLDPRISPGPRRTLKRWNPQPDPEGFSRWLNQNLDFLAAQFDLTFDELRATFTPPGGLPIACAVIVEPVSAS
jgi:hypothetical protein